jgi:hypothetical protein
VISKKVRFDKQEKARVEGAMWQYFNATALIVLFSSDDLIPLKVIEIFCGEEKGIWR